MTISFSFFSILFIKLIHCNGRLSKGNASVIWRDKAVMQYVKTTFFKLVHDQFGQKRPIPANGGKVIVHEDGLEIHPVTKLHGGVVDSFGDHRIAMCAAIAATRCTAPVIIRGAECVEKSYPAFFDDYQHLGGIANGIILE